MRPRAPVTLRSARRLGLLSAAGRLRLSPGEGDRLCPGRPGTSGLVERPQPRFEDIVLIQIAPMEPASRREACRPSPTEIKGILEQNKSRHLRMLPLGGSHCLYSTFKKVVVVVDFVHVTPFDEGCQEHQVRPAPSSPGSPASCV